MYVASIIVFALIATWLAADFVYSRYVAFRLRRWERSIQWDEGGVRVECREYTIGKGPAAILLIHGFNDSPRIYDLMAPVFAAAGFTVRVMRLPGFAVRMEETQRVKREDWLAAVRGELALLRAEHSHVFAVGHSLGGALAIGAVEGNAQLADGLALLAPVLSVAPSRSPVLTPRQWHELSRRLLVFTRVALSPFTNDSKDPQYRGYSWGTKFSSTAVYRQFFELLDNNRQAANKLAVPTIMILARADRIIDNRAAETFLEQSAATRKELHYLDRAAHAIPLDFGWQDASQAIIEFFRSLMSGTAPAAENRTAK